MCMLQVFNNLNFEGAEQTYEGHRQGSSARTFKTKCMLQVFNNLNFEGAEKHTKGTGKVHVAKDEAGRQVRTCMHGLRICVLRHGSHMPTLALQHVLYACKLTCACPSALRSVQARLWRAVAMLCVPQVDVQPLYFAACCFKQECGCSTCLFGAFTQRVATSSRTRDRARVSQCPHHGQHLLMRNLFVHEPCA